MKGPRIASLVQNLRESIERLRDHLRFNLVDFGGDVEILYKDTLTDRKNMAQGRVSKMDLGLATRTYCAMRQGTAVPGADTIYFLSDGAPARDSMANWSDIQVAIQVTTHYCPTAIFCIDFDPKAGNQASMRQLADWNAGQHESVIIH